MERTRPLAAILGLPKHCLHQYEQAVEAHDLRTTAFSFIPNPAACSI